MVGSKGLDKGTGTKAGRGKGWRDSLLITVANRAENGQGQERGGGQGQVKGGGDHGLGREDMEEVDPDQEIEGGQDQEIGVQDEMVEEEEEAGVEIEIEGGGTEMTRAGTWRSK